jgi:hypothetical protein
MEATRQPEANMMNNDFVIGEFEEQKEAWKADHDEAMACYDLEETIRRGIALFGMIRLADESWSKKVQSGSAKFDADRLRTIKNQYEWWLAPCSGILETLAKAEASFSQVENAAYFRGCVTLARKLVFVDVEGLIEAAGQIARGEVEPYDGEVEIGLQNKLDPQSKAKLSRPSKPRSGTSRKRAD